MEFAKFRALMRGWCILFVLSASTAASDGPEGTKRTFRVVVDSRVELTYPHKTEQLVGKTEIEYVRKRSGEHVELSLTSIKVKTTRNGVTIAETKQTRSGVVNTKDGVTKEIPFEKLSLSHQRTYQDSFGAPLCKLTVDENGKVVDRTILAGVGAKWLLENNMLTYILLMHPPFHANDDKWEFNAPISASSRGIITVPLTYAKVDNEHNGIRVGFSGKLSADKAPTAKRPMAENNSQQMTMKNVQHVISGEQQYDLAKREWTAGKLVNDYSYDKIEDGRYACSVKGTLVLSLTEVPAQTRPPEENRD